MCLWASHTLIHDGFWAVAEGQAHDQSEGDLSSNFDPTIESIFILAEGLDIVVCKTDTPQDDGGYQHENHVDITQSPEQ